jgi:hypothetical protein
MNNSQQISAEALNAIENLTDAVDAFVRALQVAADQDTHNRGYWIGFIAQIKHVTEHGGAALQAPMAELLPVSDGTPNRVRMDALFDASQALEGAAKRTFRASILFGRKDEHLTSEH